MRRFLLCLIKKKRKKSQRNRQKTVNKHRTKKLRKRKQKYQKLCNRQFLISMLIRMESLRLKTEYFQNHMH